MTALILSIIVAAMAWRLVNAAQTARTLKEKLAELTTERENLREKLLCEVNLIKSTEERLKKSEQFYHLLVETTQDLVWQCDAEGKYTFLNIAWEYAFGYELREMLGKKVSDFQTTENAVSSLYVFEQLKRGELLEHYEATLTDKAGNEVHLVFNAFCLTDEHGIFIGANGTAHDITERKKIEDALRHSEQNYRILFDNAADSVFIHDAEKILAVNPQACIRLGYSREELMALNPGNIDSPEQFRHMPERIAKLNEYGFLRFETEHMRKNGTKILTEATASRIVWDGKPAILAITRDITERKLAEDKLIREKNTRFNSWLNRAGP